MKNRITSSEKAVLLPWTFAVLCLFSAVNQTFAQTCLCLNPAAVSWWKAEENAVDSVSGHNGFLQNGVGFITGKVGNAFHLDGVDDYITIADAPALRPASLTIEGWIRLAQADSIHLIIAKPVGDSFFNSYNIHVQGGMLHAAIGDLTQFSQPLSSPVQTGQWYHVAFTFDDASNSQALYVNGVLVDSASTSMSIVYDNHPVFLGADDEGSSGGITWHFSGDLDEITLYRAALSADQILAIYNAGTAGKAVAPVISALPAPAVIDCPASPLLITPTATDACGGELPLSFSDTITLGPCAASYSVTRTWTTTDQCGKTASATQTITVVDSIAPELTCPSDLVVTTDSGQCHATIALATPHASDNCDPSPAVVGTRSDDQPLSAVYPLGVTTVTWTAFDCVGNVVNCTQTIQVQDSTPPQLACASDMVVEADPGQCSARVSFSLPQATDLCSALGQVVCNPPSGSSFAIGTNVVECAVSDAAGNSGRCEFSVIVRDLEMPAIVCPADISVTTLDSNAVNRAVFYESPAVSDNCAATIECLPASGSLFPIGITTVNCRALDVSGNSATCDFVIRVTSADSTPRSQKLQVREDLILLLGTITNSTTRSNVTEAISQLTKGLAPSRWLDDFHLAPNQTGEKVFNFDKRTVAALLQLNSTNQSEIPASQVQNLVERLVETDAELAAIALSEAIARQGRDNKIDNATKDQGRGDTAVTVGDFEQAIDRYRGAWKGAVSA